MAACRKQALPETSWSCPHLPTRLTAQPFHTPHLHIYLGVRGNRTPSPPPAPFIDGAAVRTAHPVRRVLPRVGEPPPAGFQDAPRCSPSRTRSVERDAPSSLEARGPPLSVPRAHLQRLLLSRGRRGPPPSPTRSRGEDPTRGPGRAGKGPVGPRRGGGDEEGARRSSSTSSVSQSRYRRRRQSFPPRGEAWSQLSAPKPPTTPQAAPARPDPGPRPLRLGARGLAGAPPPRPRARHSPPGRPRGMCAPRGRRPLGTRLCARRPAPEVGLAEPQLLPGDRGAENCARCPPLPPQRCHR